MEWVASWTSCFIYGIQFFLEKTTDRESMLFLKKMADMFCLFENEQRVSDTSENN